MSKVNASVAKMVDELKKNPSTRFSKSDFQGLIYAILADEDFKAKKFMIKGDAIIEDSHSINGDMRKFLDKLLKHAGISNAAERETVIASFEYSPRDVEWVADAVDKAMSIYSETGKNMRLFRDEMIQLSVRKITRNGKYQGRTGFRKSVTDLDEKVAKSKK